MVTIEIDGEKRLRNFNNRVKNNFEPFTRRATWMIAQTTSKHLKRASFKRPRGTLAGSIRPVKLGDDLYGIEMIGYAPFVDTGRRPGRRPPSGPYSKIAGWAGGPKKGLYMGRHIAKHGTKPTWFIYKGMEKAGPEWEQSLQNHLDYFFKSGGRIL